MDESWEKWLSDLEMDECHLFNELNMNSLVEELKEEMNYSCDSIFTAADNSNNMENLSSSSEKPTSLFSSNILSFEDSTTVPNVPNKTCQYHGERENLETREETHTRKCKTGRNTCQTQDRIIAERKRRENLTNMLVELSAIIPGLKKMDKLSIVNNAIDHVRYLQNRIQELEEQNKKKVEYITSFKNNKPNVEDFSWISDGIDDTKTFPNVEARVSAKDVLIRVICNKEKDIVTKLLSKLAAHNLSIVCSNFLPFGNSTLNISIIAKVDREFNMAMDDLVKNLNKDLLKCCNLQK